ncbi:MAG: NYN domain-containing protein, partial [Wujia sp.]
HLPDTDVTLLDTPGHVDFAAEMERTLCVLDYAILVLSAGDGIQGHTKTLWRLLRQYEIPTIIVVNKMDQPDNDTERIMQNLKDGLSEDCVCFSGYRDESCFMPVDWMEEIAMASDKEEILDAYMQTGTVEIEQIREMIKHRTLFPCYFISALKLIGIEELLTGLNTYTDSSYHDEAEFGAKAFKVTRDEKGNRLLHIKVIQGTLMVRESIQGQKVTQIRRYQGEGYESIQVLHAGQIGAVTGFDELGAGACIGCYQDMHGELLEPVLTYRMSFPENVSPRLMYGKLKELEEELPELHISWIEETENVHVMLMGQVQIEILTQLIKTRFGVVPTFDTGQISYKETIADSVIGVGHFEPLRHYAEAHIRIEPGERGSGIQVEADCSEDLLAKNWQRLIMTHLQEKTHVGVKLGCPLTDVKFTVINGRAHNKHTEGGDFRQATYRAVRQGLMEAQTVVLEPQYNFELELPQSMIGKAMTDLEAMYATIEPPQLQGENAILRGYGPVATLRDYQIHVRAYTRGCGNLQVSLRGYDVCHNEEEVVKQRNYDPEADLKNPTSSVFCAHGSGFLVPWDQVKAYMHVQDDEGAETEDTSYEVRSRERFDYSIGIDEIDEILARTTANQNQKKQIYKRRRAQEPVGSTVHRKIEAPKEKLSLVDGYNVILAWEELKQLADINMDSAKDKLVSVLSNYKSMTHQELLIVFDGYKVKGNHGSREEREDVTVIHTKEGETADQFIEKFTHQEKNKYQITVATGDHLIQTITRGAGCRILSARDLYLRMEEEAKAFRDYMEELL